MVKQKNMIDVFEIDNHIITLEHLKNTNAGCPRYHAVIINKNTCSNWVFNFTGHYLSPKDEAKWILEHHLKLQN